MGRARPMVMETNAFQFHIDGQDVVYGPTGRRRLSAIDSRHKAAWLWCMVWSETANPDRDGVLDLIDQRGHILDQSDGDGWPIILEEMIEQKGLLVSERERPAVRFRVVRWEDGDYLPIPPPPTWRGAEFRDTEVELVLAYCDYSLGHPDEEPLRIDELLSEAEQADERAADVLLARFVGPALVRKE